jgi:hypothetical protein
MESLNSLISLRVHMEAAEIVGNSPGLQNITTLLSCNLCQPVMLKLQGSIHNETKQQMHWTINALDSRNKKTDYTGGTTESRSLTSVQPQDIIYFYYWHLCFYTFTNTNMFIFNITTTTSEMLGFNFMLPESFL